MKISRKFFFVLFIFFFVSCKENKELKNYSFELSGVISNSTQPHLILSEVGKSGFTQNDTIPIDKKGNFSQSIETINEQLCKLCELTEEEKDYIKSIINPME